jgi:hypothetical protein
VRERDRDRDREIFYQNIQTLSDNFPDTTFTHSEEGLNLAVKHQLYIQTNGKRSTTEIVFFLKTTAGLQVVKL